MSRLISDPGRSPDVAAESCLSDGERWRASRYLVSQPCDSCFTAPQSCTRRAQAIIAEFPRHFGGWFYGPRARHPPRPEVWQARDTTLDRDVALKVLPEAFTSDPDRLARFEREANVLASLNHPNIGSILPIKDFS